MNDKFDYVYDYGNGRWLRPGEESEPRWRVVANAVLSGLAMAVCLTAVLMMFLCM